MSFENAMIAAVFIGFMFMIGWWTYAYNENYRLCLEHGGNHSSHSGCTIPR